MKRSAKALWSTATGLFFSLVGAAGVCAEAPSTRLQASANVEDRMTWLSVSSVDVGRPLPTDSTTLQRQQILEHRLRAGATVRWRPSAGWLEEVEVQTQADVFAGPLWRNQEIDLLAHDSISGRAVAPLSLEQHRIRMLRAQLTSTMGRLTVGRMVSQWGLGLLAQGGDRDPMQFGIKRAKQKHAGR